MCWVAHFYDKDPITRLMTWHGHPLANIVCSVDRSAVDVIEVFANHKGHVCPRPLQRTIQRYLPAGSGLKEQRDAMVIEI